MTSVTPKALNRVSTFNCSALYEISKVAAGSCSSLGIKRKDKEQWNQEMRESMNWITVTLPFNMYQEDRHSPFGMKLQLMVNVIGQFELKFIATILSNFL